MRKLLLALPVLVIGGPLVVFLVLTTGADQPAAPRPPEAPPAVVHDKKDLPDDAGMEKLARDNPVEFLNDCIVRTRKEVKTGYTATMVKQERLAGKLYPKEVVEVAFRQKPFSVLLHWVQGARKAEAALYVEGENKGMMLVHPAGLAGRLVSVVERPVDGPDARASGRYTLKEFGIEKGMVRTLGTWEESKKHDKLTVEYLGEKKLFEADNRLCWCVRRKYAEPSPDGVMELTLYLDKKTWLQIGSVLKDKDGRLIGEYYFRDLKLNPEFKPGQFERVALTP
jgi:hypothetical protein